MKKFDNKFTESSVMEIYQTTVRPGTAKAKFTLIELLVIIVTYPNMHRGKIAVLL